MELKEKDLKLLASLYHNNREPLTKIAKETGMTRIQVEHSMKKFAREGIIQKFFTMFNYKAFGYSVYAFILIKLEKFSTLKSFTKKLEESKNCISWGECFGKYDLFTNLIFRDEKDMGDFLSKLVGEENAQVLDYMIVKPYLAEYHPLKIFGDVKKSIVPIVTEESIKKKFSEKDLKILKILQMDGRIKIIDIAKKVNMSAELVLHKVKKFQKENVIVGVKAGIRMKKLGYNYSIIFINVKNFSERLRKKIIDFARKGERINTLVLSLFNPNCVMQVFHKTTDELKEEIRKIKNLFKEEVFDLDVVLAQEEDRVNTLPFLD